MRRRIHAGTIVALLSAGALTAAAAAPRPMTRRDITTVRRG